METNQDGDGVKPDEELIEFTYKGIDTASMLARLYGRLGNAVLLPIPKKQKGPVFLDWQKTTFEQTQLGKLYLLGASSKLPYDEQEQEWEYSYFNEINYSLYRGGNIGVRLGRLSNGLCTIDADSDEVLQWILENNPQLEKTFRTKGARGAQIWIKPEGQYPEKVYKLKAKDGSDLKLEWRADSQSVVYGEHPDTKKPYKILVDAPPIVIGFDSIKWPEQAVLPWLKGNEPGPAQSRVKSSGANGGEWFKRYRGDLTSLTCSSRYSSQRRAVPQRPTRQGTERLHHKFWQQQRLGDQHGDKYSDRIANLRRQRPLWRGGHPRRQHGLCCKLERRHGFGDRYGDNTVTATIPDDGRPAGVAVTPDGSMVYVTNFENSTVLVIETATNTVTTITGFSNPVGVAITPDSRKAYVANQGGGTVSVITTATNMVTATITVGSFPTGVAVTPDGSTVYVTNQSGNTVSVIETATNTVTTITGFSGPVGVAVTPDGSTVYVANGDDNTVSVIDTASNTVTTTIGGFSGPIAFGLFIGPAPFAGTPGQPNCNGKTVSALATKYGGLDKAAQALGFPSVQALKNAIESFCSQ